jgi:predicted phage terminase large subunit-like protein
MAAKRKLTEDEIDEIEYNAYRARYEENCDKAKGNFCIFMRLNDHTFLMNWHHRIIARRIERMISNTNRDRIIISVPPQTGKSTQVSTLLAPFALGINPDQKIVIASNAGSLANVFNGRAQNIMQSQTYKDIFPATKIPIVGRRNTTRAKRTQNLVEIIAQRGSLRSVGLGANLTGHPADGLIIDDPYAKMSDVFSDAYRLKVLNWWEAVGQTRLSRNAWVILMHTRWSEADLAGELIRRGELGTGDVWEELIFPMVSEPGLPPLHPDDPRSDGSNEPLHPALKGGMDYMETVKRNVGPVVWNSLFLQSPTIIGGNHVTKDQFKFYRSYTDLPHGTIEYSWDLTFGSLKKKASYVLGQAWLKGIDGNFYLLDQFRKKCGFIEQLAAVEAMAMRWGPTHMLNIENKANGAAIMDSLAGHAKICNINPVEPCGDKESRFIAVTPLFYQGKVFVLTLNGCHGYRLTI